MADENQDEVTYDTWDVVQYNYRKKQRKRREENEEE